MDFFDTTPSKSLPSDKKKATASKSTDDTKQVSSVSVDFFTASSGSGPGATVTPEKSGGFLRLPKPSKKKTPPRVREDASAAASSRTERVSAVSVSTLSRPSQSSRAIPKFGQGTPVSQQKLMLAFVYLHFNDGLKYIGFTPTCHFDGWQNHVVLLPSLQIAQRRCLGGRCLHRPLRHRFATGVGVSSRWHLGCCKKIKKM